MPQLIEVPSIGLVEFPDDMPDEAIVKAIKRDSLYRQKDEATQAANRAGLAEKALATAEGALRPLDFGGIAGRGLSSAGHIARGAAIDLMQGRVMPKEGRLVPDMQAARAAAQGQPVDESWMNSWQSGVADAAQGIPMVAGAMGAMALGIPAPLAFGAGMGLTTAAETGDARATAQAAMTGAVIPGVGAWGSRLGAKLIAPLVKRGVIKAESGTLQKTIEAGFANLAVQTLIEALNAPEYMRMEPEQRRDAIIRSLMANLIMGGPDVVRILSKMPSDTQQLLVKDIEFIVQQSLPELASPELVDSAARRGFDPRRSDALRVDEINLTDPTGPAPEMPASTDTRTFMVAPDMPPPPSPDPAPPAAALKAAVDGRPAPWRQEASPEDQPYLAKFDGFADRIQKGTTLKEIQDALEQAGKHPESSVESTALLRDMAGEKLRVMRERQAAREQAQEDAAILALPPEQRIRAIQQKLDQIRAQEQNRADSTGERDSLLKENAEYSRWTAELESARVAGPRPQAAETSEYASASDAHTAASKVFTAAQLAYRARTIGDAEFIAARKAFDAATEIYDAAYAAEEARESRRPRAGARPNEQQGSAMPAEPGEIPGPKLAAGNSPRPTPPEPVKPPPELVREEARPEPAKQAADFSPKVAKAQRTYLLDEVQKLMESAPERRPDTAGDADMDALNGVHSYIAGEDAAAYKAREQETLARLMEQYGIPENSNAAVRRAQLKEAIERAIYEAAPKITIEIPGDGTFQVIHSLDALTQFLERAKRFPVTAAKVKEPSNPRTAPTKPAPLSTKVDEKTLRSALGEFISTDKEREVLNHVWSDGVQSVSTDGSIMLVVEKGIGPKDKQGHIYTLAGKRIERDAIRAYPNWSQVLPKKTVTIAKDLDAARLFAIIKQAEGVMTEGSRSVVLHLNRDGSIGVRANGPDTGEYTHNIQPESVLLGALNPEYLTTTLNAARKLGSEKFDLHVADESLGTFVFTGPGWKVVLMPMRMGDESKSTADAIRAFTRPSKARKAAEGTAGVEASPVPPVIGLDIGAGPRTAPDPATDPTYSVFPVNLAEAVRFARDLLGRYPIVREKIRALGGQAAGVFRHTDGPDGRGQIELRADIADLLNPAQKAALRAEADAYAAKVADTPAEIAKIASERYKYLLEQAYAEARKHPPATALKVIWHEIGHVVDWMQEKMIAGRGNLFGRIASLKDYLKHVIALDPDQPAGKPPSAGERHRLRQQAETQLREELGPIREIVRKIITEEPELRIRGITPEDVKKLFGMDAREQSPELYRWFAEQPAQVKKEIVRQAMKGVLDARLAAMGTSEVIGTRKVERTVREKVGREPSPAEIQDRFRKLLREEIRRRNLAELQTVKGELEGAIAWWWGADKMPEYFRRSSEMYADAFSIFMNNPAAMQRMAPTYFRMMMSYMDRKPDVAKLYDQIQNEIKAGQVEDITEARMLDSWDRADAESLEAARTGRKTGMQDFLDNVRYHMDRRFGPIYRAAAGTKHEGPIYRALTDYLYRASEHELFLNRMNNTVGQRLVDHNLDWKDLGRYLFYNRITQERYKIFNPYGVAPDRALNRLENMRKNMGERSWTALETAAGEFRALYEQHVVSKMKEARLWTPELQTLIEDNVHYAFFDVRKDDPGTDGISRLLDMTYGAAASPHIYRQVGTVKEIKNPATATVMKALSLISAAHRNIAKSTTVRMLLDPDQPAGNIAPAVMRWTGKRQEPVIRDTEGVGTVVFLEDGQIKAYYVRKVVADALNGGDPIRNRLMIGLTKATAALKTSYTQYNYGFWPVAFARDVVGWNLQLPGVSPLSYLKHLPKSWRAARDSVKGRRNLLAEQALERQMLISRADPRGIWSSAENEFEAGVASYGMTPAPWAKQGDKVHRLVKAWNTYREFGQSLERVHKIAGMLHLDETYPNLPEWKKRQIVRERAGSPDFLQRGQHSPHADIFMMFYNPWKEGLRSVATAARENPWQFGAKSTALIVAPTVLQGLAAAGALGPETEEFYDSVSDHDLTNYLVVPLGWANRKQKTVNYLRLPLWEPARILHGALWQALTGRGDGYLSFWGGTVPGMNGILTTALDFMQYEIFNQNPYDKHRGKLVMDDATFQAGGWPARKVLLKRAWNNLGGGLVHRFYDPMLSAPAETEMQEFLALPIVNNSLGRWIKTSNRGLADADRRNNKADSQARGQAQLAVREIIRKQAADHQYDLLPSERLLLRDPYAAQYHAGRWPEVVAARESQLQRRLQAAPNAAAKARIYRNEQAQRERSQQPAP